MTTDTDFTCFLYPGWSPEIRPAEPKRDWMDGTPEAYAYRCLPLNIANAHGWEILSPCDVTVRWNGRNGVGDLVVQSSGPDAPVSLFGQGILTFHIQALFRTPPGWDLWIGGSPNLFKDGISAMTGIVETDWSPYSFTMNWQMTRPDHTVSFKKGEPMCFIFPVQRGSLEKMVPKIVQLSENDDVAVHYREWSQSRNEFQAKMNDGCPRLPAEKWQKRYYRGVTMRSETPVPGHRAKIRLAPFKK